MSLGCFSTSQSLKYVHNDYLAHICLLQAQAPHAFKTILDGQPSDKQTRRTYTWRHAAKWSSFLSLHV